MNSFQDSLDSSKTPKKGLILPCLKTWAQEYFSNQQNQYPSTPVRAKQL